VFRLEAFWRRGWDSNPRYGSPYARFRGEYFQPLSHLSAMVATIILAESLRAGYADAKSMRRLSKKAAWEEVKEVKEVKGVKEKETRALAAFSGVRRRRIE
jgi:hypothetical protein